MLDEHLYTKGVPGLGEAILAEEYAEVVGQSLNSVIDEIEDRKLLGTHHLGQWYVEAPPFCEAKLKEIHSRRKREQQQQTHRQKSRQQYQDRKSGQHNHTSDAGQNGTDPERRYGLVLALNGKVSMDDVKHRYRELSHQYHPDLVQHLGPKLREVAEQEMKAINEAYQFFKAKYGE